MAVERARQLDTLQKTITTGWTEKKLEAHHSAIEKLSEKVESDKKDAAKKIQRNPSSAAAGVKRAPPMNDELNRRLIYARAMIDHEFEKQINAHTAKWAMVSELFNKGFTAPKKKLVDSDVDITFAALPDAEHCDADRLQQRWDKISKEYRDLVLMQQSVDQQVCKRTHVGEKRDQETIRSEVMAEISEAEKKFKFSKDMVTSGMSKHAFLAPPARLNLSKVASFSLATAPAPVPAPAESVSTSSPVTPVLTSCPGTPSASTQSNSDQEEKSPSPGSKKVLGKLGGGKSPASMLSRLKRKQTFQGTESNKALLTAYTAGQEKQHKERLEHDKEMQKMQCETMLKMQAMQNEHAMKMQMHMMASLSSVFGLGGGGGHRHVGGGCGVGGFVGGSGAQGAFVGGGDGPGAGGEDTIFAEGDSMDSETARDGLLGRGGP